ncbi:MAG: HDIG domain-containing protein [Planctomycetaceae bacterium]|nr:HDIG domain-containing protein [Planctomycetaceae bacterium]
MVFPFSSGKKARSARAAALRPTSAFFGRLQAVVNSRSTLLRLLMVALCLMALLLTVEAWKAAFTWRINDRADHGITARIGFHRLNSFETRRAREDAEAIVPFIFRHNPAPLESLPARLRTALGEVAQADSPADLPADIRAAFGLNAVEATVELNPAMPNEVNRDFARLKAAVSREEGTAGNRIDELIKEFEEFIRPLEKHGLADPAELARIDKLNNESTLEILPESGNGTRYLVSPAEVQLPDLLRSTGLLGKTWQQRYPELILIRRLLERWLLSEAPVTLHYDSPATQSARREARERVRIVTDDYNRGNLLLEPGQAIDEETLAVLRAEYEEIESHVTPAQRVARVVNVFLLLAVLAALNGYYLINNHPQLVKKFSRLALYLAAMVLAVAMGRWLSYDPWRAEVIPVMGTAMIFAIAYDQVLGAIMAFTLALFIVLSTTADFGQFVVLISVSATAVSRLSRVASRSSLIKIGFWAGAVYLLVSVGTDIIDGQSLQPLPVDSLVLIRSLRGMGWCLVTGFLVAGSLPFIESAFGVVTNISLLEMSDISHPLLKELVRRAPGTYNHSIAVATVGETAADSIGANGLLVRVGAYYHDIGKMLKPQYFIENMTEGMESRHLHLAPAMSTLIIIGHVKDGVDLARQHNLPRPIIDFIEQHHGTTLVEYFYRAATRKAEEQPDHRTDAEESSFRYPGPKPQSREAGVMMISDAVESASRTLSEPTPRRIESLVREITMKRLMDGQFDESTLTLSEIRTIEESLTKSLIGIYHGRIKYPEQKTA